MDTAKIQTILELEKLKIVKNYILFKTIHLNNVFLHLESRILRLVQKQN